MISNIQILYVGYSNLSKIYPVETQIAAISRDICTWRICIYRATGLSTSIPEDLRYSLLSLGYTLHRQSCIKRSYTHRTTPGDTRHFQTLP